MLRQESTHWTVRRRRFISSVNLPRGRGYEVCYRIYTHPGRKSMRTTQTGTGMENLNSLVELIIKDKQRDVVFGSVIAVILMGEI